jgi:1,4-dihydroxy-2-naphthoate octaprenyltransferase
MNLRSLFVVSRGWSLTITLINVTTGTAIAFQDGPVSFYLYFTCLLGAVFFHAGANVLNDYFDFKYRVDTPTAPTALYRPHPVFAGLAKPKELRELSTVLLGGSILIGSLLACLRTFWIGAIMAFGLFIAVFYTARPVALKYKALGEPLVFLAFGPLMLEGAYAVQRGTLSWKALYLSIPLGLLVALILLANNLRDRTHDAGTDVRTLGTLLTKEGGMALFTALSLGSYGLILAYVALNLTSWLALFVFLALPINLIYIREFRQKIPVGADAKISQVHLLFGILLILALFLEKTLFLV